jgi:two-component system sensor histidine kinase CreC
VRLRTRIFLGFFVLTGAGIFFLVRWILDDLRSRYMESTEETMVDTANLLAALLQAEMAASGGFDTLAAPAAPATSATSAASAAKTASGHSAPAARLPAERLREAFRLAYTRPLRARIHEVMKTKVDLRMYVTDSAGIVLFDSEGGRDEGRDYSRWNDVLRTLRGEYGARSTHVEPGEGSRSVMHVAAPIYAGGRVAGVLTVAKPTGSLDLFVRAASPKIAVAGGVAALAVTVLGLLATLLVTRPINRLTDYARAVRDGKAGPPPPLGRSEIGELGRAFEEMREALEGKKYVEQYVHTLTHELKSPISSVRGAAELLEEEMPAEKRAAFLANIRSEADRMRLLVERMLDLTALEGRRTLSETSRVDLSAVAGEALADVAPALQRKRLRVERDLPAGLWTSGEAFLLKQAFHNLVDNAIAFSPEGGTLAVRGSREDGEGGVSLVVEDQGPGIPDFARERVFEKFYSLQRPDTGRKSSGLGLAIVAEISRLHRGGIRLENRPEGGLRAAWRLPSA